MRIGVNLYALSLRGGGMRQYALQMLPWIVRLSNHSFVFFYASQGQSSLALILRQLSMEERARVATVEIVHQDEIFGHADRFDLFFCPLNGFAPNLVDRPTVGTLADVQEQFFPEYFTPEQRALRALIYPRIARVVTTLITISEFSKQSICRAFGVPCQKVRVTPLAANEALRVAQSEWPEHLPRLREPFVVYPANLYPHKNHECLLGALVLLRRQGIACGAVLTGHEANPGVAIAERIAAHGLGEQVLWLGHVSPGALRYLYERALALAFPSQFEGFGLPLVEAMSCRCPVVATPAASIPEVVGDAAILTEPTAEAFAAAITMLIHDAPLRGDLIARGSVRCRRFDVRALAQETLHILEEAPARFTAAASPSVRRGVTYVVRAEHGGPSLAATFASLSRELHELDEVLLLGDVGRLDERARVLWANLPGGRSLADPAAANAWPAEASHAFVCFLHEGDRLCAGASGAALVAFDAEPDRVAVIGEALTCARAGKILATRFVTPPTAPGRSPDTLPSAAVFWRKEFLRAQQEALRSPSWPDALAAAAGARAATICRTLALIESRAEIDSSDTHRPGAPRVEELSPAATADHGVAAPIAHRAKAALRRLARLLPGWLRRPLRWAYRALGRAISRRG
jgi:glycosyltransferase involved in cell wall biosynthesis